jgi:hypothetical protein
MQYYILGNVMWLPQSALYRIMKLQRGSMNRLLMPDSVLRACQIAQSGRGLGMVTASDSLSFC